MSEVEDDFEELVAGGSTTKHPCTAACITGGRKGREFKRLALTFRTELLPEPVVVILRETRFASAYSVRQNALRLTARATGSFRLYRAPRGRSEVELEVWLLKLPWTERMPWIERRVPVEVDYNEAYGYLLIDLPPGEPSRVAVPVALLAPPKQPPTPVTAPVLLGHLGDQRLNPEELRLLRILLDARGAHKSKAVLGALLRQEGIETSINSLVRRLGGKLRAAGAELMEGTSGVDVWIDAVSSQFISTRLT